MQSADSVFLNVTNVSTMASSSQHFELSKAERISLNISLLVGFAMLFMKWYAYTITGSMAIFSDAMESIVHQFAVVFAWYSLRVTYRPPDDNHHYGHDKITYFSAGFEGALIVVAAIVIVTESISRLLNPTPLEQLGAGVAITAFAGGVNALLGFYLIRVGKRHKSLIVEANGRHIMTDAWTSFGAVIGLLLAWRIGWYYLDPIIALLFGANIIFEGGKLIRNAVHGLMDQSNPEYEQQARAVLDAYCSTHHVSYHRFRLRESGQRVYVDFHLVFPDGTPIEAAHQVATDAELSIVRAIDHSVEVLSHLESTNLPEGHMD